MTKRLSQAVAWSLSACEIGIAATAVVIGPDVGEPFSQGLGEAIRVAAFPVVGALIVSRHPNNAVGWIFIVAGFWNAVSVLSGEYAHIGLLESDESSSPIAGRPTQRSDPAPLAAEAAWFEYWSWFPGLAILVIFVPLLFPDGRPPTRRWWFAGWAGLAGIVLVSGALAIPSWPVRGPTLLGNVDNVPALRSTIAPAIAGGSLAAAAALGSGAALLVRFGRSRGVERLQLKWFVFASTTLLLVVINAFTPWRLSEWMLTAGLLGMVAATGIAILKYRLYDIDLVISRSLAYTMLAGLAVAMYVGIATALGYLLEPKGLWVALVATGLVAVLFNPLRIRLQGAVDRLIYGERHDPYTALSRLGRTLEVSISPGEVLRTITKTVAVGLRVPYAGIELQNGASFVPAESHGERPSETVNLPLIYQGEIVGRLVVGKRSKVDQFSPADMRLLEDLARQSGVAVYAERLSSDLQRSREHLVITREEERRRLRRDLHDDLGPTLAGIALQIESVRTLLRGDLEAADALLARLKDETQSAIAAVRRIAYGLRPPALDELGLVAALRQEGSRFGSDGGLVVSIDAPDDLPPLPAAVEIAAYRVALEGITNAARHSEAKTCLVRVVVGANFQLEVRDDGHGLPKDFCPGVGLASMRERVAELGGSLTVDTIAPNGTHLIALLPMAGQ